MKLSLRSEYALLSLLTIARNSESGSSSDEVAKSLQVSSETLKDLFTVLLNAKYLRRSGTKLWLVKPANQISVEEIIRLFDGAFAPLEPVSEKGYGLAPMEQEQKLTDLFAGIQKQIVHRLENTTLADLL